MSLAINAVDSAAQHRLASEIFTMLSNSNASPHDVPPYEMPELIAMAAISCGQKVATEINLLGWIFRNMPYYNKLGADLFASGRKITEMITGFRDALLHPMTPVTSVVDISDNLFQHAAELLYTPDITACRIVLQNFLYPRRPVHFRLLNLPKELRLAIFEMALATPVIRHFSGNIGERRELLLKRINLRVERRLHEPDEDDMHILGDKYALPTRRPVLLLSMPQFLSLLCVSKQLHAETTPVFYDINVFSLRFEDTFGAFARQLAAARMQFVTNLTIHYDSPIGRDHSRAIQAIDAFMTIPKLKSIVLVTADDYWFRAPQSTIRRIKGRDKHYSKPADLPGMSQLIGLLAKAATVTFEGKGRTCERIEEYMQAEIEKRQAPVIGDVEIFELSFSGEKRKRED